MNNLEKIAIYSLLVICVVLGVINLESKSSGALGTYIDSNQVSRFTDMNVTNDVVIDGQLTVDGASSTITAYGATDKTGCIKLGDSRGSAYIPVYLSVSSSTVSATTTKPAYCK